LLELLCGDVSISEWGDELLELPSWQISAFFNGCTDVELHPLF
jgi:hypothetical protein